VTFIQGTENHGHPEAAYVRGCFGDAIAQRIQRLHPNAKVLDYCGAYQRNGKRKNWHIATPILCDADHVRTKTRCAAHGTSTNHCDHTFDACRCIIPDIVFLEQTVYFVQDQLKDLIEKSTQGFVLATAHPYLNAWGTHYGGEQKWRRIYDAQTGETRVVVDTVLNGPPYEHDPCDWLWTTGVKSVPGGRLVARPWMNSASDLTCFAITFRPCNDAVPDVVSKASVRARQLLSGLTANVIAPTFVKEEAKGSWWQSASDHYWVPRAFMGDLLTRVAYTSRDAETRGSYMRYVKQRIEDLDPPADLKHDLCTFAELLRVASIEAEMPALRVTHQWQDRLELHERLLDPPKKFDWWAWRWWLVAAVAAFWAVGFMEIMGHIIEAVGHYAPVPAFVRWLWSQYRPMLASSAGDYGPVTLAACWLASMQGHLFRWTDRWVRHRGPTFVANAWVKFGEYRLRRIKHEPRTHFRPADRYRVEKPHLAIIGPAHTGYPCAAPNRDADAENQALVGRVLAAPANLAEPAEEEKYRAWVWANRERLFPGMRDSVRPMPFHKWLSRYPPAYQVRMRAAYRATAGAYLEHSSYATRLLVKLEVGGPLGDDGDYGSDPRAILSSTDELNASLGPYTVALSEAIKLVWDGVSGRPLYATGRSVSEMSRWIGDHVDAGHGYLEYDASRYDSTITMSDQHLECALFVWMLQPEYKATFARLYRACMVTSGTSRLGAVFSVAGPRASGRPHTSLANTVQNGCEKTYLLNPDFRPDTGCMVFGDDSLIAGPGLTVKAAWYERAVATLGKRMKRALHEDAEDMTFTSMSLHCCKDSTWLFVPSFARMVFHSGYSVSPPLDATSDQLQGMRLRSMYPYIRRSPIHLFFYNLRMAAVGNLPAVLRWAPHRWFKLPPDAGSPTTQGWVRRRYGVSAAAMAAALAWSVSFKAGLYSDATIATLLIDVAAAPLLEEVLRAVLGWPFTVCIILHETWLRGSLVAALLHVTNTGAPVEVAVGVHAAYNAAAVGQSVWALGVLAIAALYRYVLLHESPEEGRSCGGASDCSSGAGGGKRGEESSRHTQAGFWAGKVASDEGGWSGQQKCRQESAQLDETSDLGANRGQQHQPGHRQGHGEVDQSLLATANHDKDKGPEDGPSSHETSRGRARDERRQGRKGRPNPPTAFSQIRRHWWIVAVVLLCGSACCYGGLVDCVPWRYAPTDSTQRDVSSCISSVKLHQSLVHDAADSLKRAAVSVARGVGEQLSELSVELNDRAVQAAQRYVVDRGSDHRDLHGYHDPRTGDLCDCSWFGRGRGGQCLVCGGEASRRANDSGSQALQHWRRVRDGSGTDGVVLWYLERGGRRL